MASILTNWYMIHMYISNKLRVQEIFETYFQVYRLFWRTFLSWKIYVFICLHLNFRALMRKWHWKKDEKIVRQKQCLNPQIFRKLGSMARFLLWKINVNTAQKIMQHYCSGNELKRKHWMIPLWITQPNINYDYF